MYSYDITVALANDRRSKLQADAARSHEARAARQARKAARRAEAPLARQRALPPLLARTFAVDRGGGCGADRPSRVKPSVRPAACSPTVAAASPPAACDVRRNLASGTYRATVVDPDELLRFRSGDPEAVRAVYREYGSSVFAVAYKALGSRDLAEEATQQTFVKAWRAAATYDPARELGPWLATIARRTAIDIHRREARRPTVQLDEASLIDLPDGVDQSFDVWAVRGAIDELPPLEREVVRLQHLESLTQAEIAERLGVPVGTIKSRSFRAHRLLAARLGHLRGAGK